MALAGFGIDSDIEIFASLTVVWQLKAANNGKEHVAERLIGIAFLLLALYMLTQYDAYENLKSSTGSTSNPFQYAGQYTDSESGLQYLRARYYDPSTE